MADNDSTMQKLLLENQRLKKETQMLREELERMQR